MITLLLVLPGLIVLYALVIRALLMKVPALQKFYTEANGFWAKVWAICGKSLTMIWSHIVGGVGAMFVLLDKVAPFVGDQDLKDKVTSALAGHPQYAGYVLVAISLITIAVRMRSIATGQ